MENGVGKNFLKLGGFVLVMFLVGYLVYTWFQVRA